MYNKIGVGIGISRAFRHEEEKATRKSIVLLSFDKQVAMNPQKFSDTYTSCLRDTLPY